MKSVFRFVSLLALAWTSAAGPRPTDLARFEQADGLFSIEYPDDWQALPANLGAAVALAPADGIVTAADGQPVMLYGVIVDHYEPQAGHTGREASDPEPRSGSLEEKSDDLVRQIIAANPHLRARADPGPHELLDGADTHRIVLDGLSPVSGQAQRVTLAVRGLADGHVLYAMSVAPRLGDESMPQTLAGMLRSLRVDDGSHHHPVPTAAQLQP